MQVKRLIYLILIIFAYPSFAVSVSANSECNANTLSYNFDNYGVDSYFEIEFNTVVYNPDYSFKVIENKDGADIVFEDNTSYGISVCKSIKGKNIKISNYGFDPDLTIKILNYGFDYDFTIFNNSKIFSIKEAISVVVIPNFSILDLTKL